MFANLKNSKTHNFFFFASFKKLKKHEIKFLQVDTHRAFDSGSVYFISECQGLDMHGDGFRSLPKHPMGPKKHFRHRQCGN